MSQLQDKAESQGKAQGKPARTAADILLRDTLDDGIVDCWALERREEDVMGLDRVEIATLTLEYGGAWGFIMASARCTSWV